MKLWERILGAALSALALASVVTLAFYITDLRRVTECQASYNAVFANANAERVEAAKDDRAAIRTFLTSLAQPGATPDQRATAYATYLRQLDDADQRRDDNPLPTERCG